MIRPGAALHACGCIFVTFLFDLAPISEAARRTTTAYRKCAAFISIMYA
jgi:hypothetical protein